MADAMVLNAQPVFLTSLTTAIGFLTLNFSDSPPFRLMGNLTAFGVGAAWLYSMTVLPAVLAVTSGRVPAQDRPGLVQRGVECLAHIVTSNSRQILVGLVACPFPAWHNENILRTPFENLAVDRRPPRPLHDRKDRRVG